MIIYRYFTTSILLVALTSTVQAQNQKDPFGHVPPRIVVVHRIDDTVSEVSLNVTRVRQVPVQYAVKVPVEVTEKINKGGKIFVIRKTIFKIETRVGVRSVNETVAKTFKKANISFYDKKGKKLAKDKVWNQLKKGDLVLISADGKVVAPRFLGIVRDGTPILVVRTPQAKAAK